jgi:hypothetical protein
VQVGLIARQPSPCNTDDRITNDEHLTDCPTCTKRIVVGSFNQSKMKVEIELSEVEYLKSQLNESKKRNDELEAKLNELSESELKQKAVSLAYRLFDNYMGCVFTHLGFENWQRESVIIHDNLEHWIGKSWWNSERIKVEIGANVSNTFRKAFLSIGIIPKEEVEKKDDYEL